VVTGTQSLLFIETSFRKEMATKAQRRARAAAEEHSDEGTASGTLAAVGSKRGLGVIVILLHESRFNCQGYRIPRSIRSTFLRVQHRSASADTSDEHSGGSDFDARMKGRLSSGEGEAVGRGIRQDRRAIG
jgi:hypothetical protein